MLESFQDESVVANALVTVGEAILVAEPIMFLVAAFSGLNQFCNDKMNMKMVSKTKSPD